jgi:hypothetical protein
MWREKGKKKIFFLRRGRKSINREKFERKTQRKGGKKMRRTKNRSTKIILAVMPDSVALAVWRSRHALTIILSDRSAPNSTSRRAQARHHGGSRTISVIIVLYTHIYNSHRDRRERERWSGIKWVLGCWGNRGRGPDKRRQAVQSSMRNDEHRRQRKREYEQNGSERYDMQHQFQGSNKKSTETIEKN